MKAARNRRGGGGQRPLRVGEELRHALARIVQRGELRDPALLGRAITVTEVKVAPDLKSAHVYVTPLGGADAELVVAALRRAAPYLRGRLAEEVELRSVPELAFHWDRRFETSNRIATLLQSEQVRRDVAAPPDAPEPDDGA